MIELQERQGASAGSQSQTLDGKRSQRNGAGSTIVDVEIEVSVTEHARDDVERGLPSEFGSPSEGHFAYARGATIAE